MNYSFWIVGKSDSFRSFKFPDAIFNVTGTLSKRQANSEESILEKKRMSYCVQWATFLSRKRVPFLLVDVLVSFPSIQQN